MLSIIGLLKRLRGTQRALARTLALVVLFVALAAHTVTAADADSFEPIFNGKTLSGWEGDPTYWRVENGALVGEITPATLLKRNSFILWRGGEVEDFELKLQYRVSSKGNSGIGYRCVPIEGEPWAVRGYQADIEGDDNWTGINYEERGRTFLAHRGQKTIVEPGERPRLVEQFARPEELQARVRKNDWNDYHVIVRGSRMIHILNGHLMSEVLDRDGRLGQRRGLLGVQVHVGPPMMIEYRNILLKGRPDRRVPPGPSSGRETSAQVRQPNGVGRSAEASGAPDAAAPATTPARGPRIDPGVKGALCP